LDKSPVHYYKKMLKIRLFENKVLDLFKENEISGTAHTYIGQEATAVSLMENLKENDIIFSNHRCHGHYLAYGAPMDKLFSELMARETGVCEGLGGSQHIHYRRLYSNGVQGGIVPNAAGMAWAEKLNHSGNIAVVFIGDGTLGQGIVYESFNMASIYRIPILFVIENNRYAMTTKVEDAVGGSILARPKSFGIGTSEIESNDVFSLSDAFQKAVDFVRTNQAPFCQIIHTYRLGAHSKGDDTRDQAEIEGRRKFDPLILAGREIDEQTKQRIHDEVMREIDDSVRSAKASRHKIIDCEQTTDYKKPSDLGSILNTDDVKCVISLNKALFDVLCENKDAILLGEDIRDPYGGAFKVTKGLSSKFNDRVINTPISEAAIIGHGVGLALNGKKPIIELMFGDFLSLGFDQILNHATKYNWMYAGTTKVPIIIRAPMGAGRGYGATHSQSLEKFFTGIPELTVVALSPIHNCGEVLKRSVQYSDSPLLLIENKKLYGEKLYQCKNGMIEDFYVQESKSLFPTFNLTLDSTSNANVAIVAYGGMVKEAMKAAKSLLIKDEILMNIIVPTMISPYPIDEITSFMRRIPAVGTLEEGTIRLGWGAELIASLSERKAAERYFRIASKNLPIPCSVELEKYVIPDASIIEKEVRRVLSNE
jgi:2-oxoisovalerate dehydrogenase E1 component